MRGINSIAKAVIAGVRHRLERGVVAVRVHDGEDQRALLVVGKLGRGRPAHLEHDIGALDGARRHGRAGGGVFGVGNAGFLAGARLDHDIGAERLHLLDGFRRRGDPVFARLDFTRYGNAHAPVSSCAATTFGPGQPPEVSASVNSETTTMTMLGVRAPLMKPCSATRVAATRITKARNQ